MSGEAWSADREFAASRVHYQPVPRAELRLAGMSLASITNVPQSQAASDITAVGLLTHYLDSSSHGSLNSAVSSQASLIHDFTAYLQQARAWHAVMDSEPCAAQQQSMDASTSTTVDPVSSTLRTVRRSVPAIFFSESFDVQDPATFHTACPVGDQGEGECIAALEGHLDMVDSALETEVVQRATELLDVSVDVGKLGTALRGLNDHAKSVWESISAHKQQLEWEGTTVSRLKRRKEHLKALKQKLTEVVAIRQALSSLQGLLEVSEWLSAAEALAHVRTLHAECEGTKSLCCLTSIPAQLDRLHAQLCGSITKAVADAAEFKGMDEVTLACCKELQEASTFEHFTFHGGLTGHFSSTALGVGLPPTPAPDGSLPAIWELQQAALWPPFMAAQRCKRLDQCLESFSEAAVAATKAAITGHLHACIQALLKGDRGAGGAVAPPESAPMEDLLQWLRPAAFLALLQSLALLLRVVHWFYEGCGVLMGAALTAVQGTAEERAAISRANRRIVQLTLDAFQRRWARLLEAMYASDLEAYAGSGGGEAAPVSLAGFREVTEISSEVVKLCASDGRTATGLVSILQVLGKHLLKGHASGLQLQLELVLKSEQWVPSAVEGSVQRFLDHLFQPPANGSTAQLGGAEDISGPSTNGARARSMHEGSSPHAPSIDSSPSRAADSTSLALALDSAVNTEEAAKRLQGLPGADNRQYGASGAEEHRGEAPVDTALYVGDQRFVVVGSAGLLLQHVQALLAFGHAHVALRYEMGTRVAALVRAFDTGSQELLLGAAAISSAGLRSITARHMGVCSQCLLLLEVVLPRLRSTALEGLPAAQVASLATIYESVAEGLIQHRQKIHNKLVSIMRERLSQSLKSLHTTSASWAEYEGPGIALNGGSSRAASPTSQPRKPKAIAKMISQLSKQVTALHEAISPVMSQAQLLDVGVRIRRMYSESLARALRSLPSGGVNWLLAVEHDVTLLNQALSLMPAPTPEHGLEAFAEYLQRVRELIQEQENVSAPVPDDAINTAESDVPNHDVETSKDNHAACVTANQARAADTTDSRLQIPEDMPSDMHDERHMPLSATALQSAISDPLAVAAAASETRDEALVLPDPESHRKATEVETEGGTHPSPRAAEHDTESAAQTDSALVADDEGKHECNESHEFANEAETDVGTQPESTEDHTDAVVPDCPNVADDEGKHDTT